MTQTAPLTGIKVLDLTRVLAGPFCTMILADLGAEVIKLEVPKTGDDARAFGPFMNGKSLYYTAINHDKKSISMNLKSDKAKDIFREMVKKVDIVVENFRPGTMEKLGLGYDDLKEINPKIIYAAVSGYGHTGPESQKPGYDMLAQARGGVMSITGWHDDERPTRVGVSFGDLTGGLYTVIGILAAVHQAKETGLGQKVDVSLLDAQIAMLENALSRYQASGKAPQPIGHRHPSITPFQAFKAKDRYFVIAVGNDAMFKKLCEAIGAPALLQNLRYTSNKLRNENIDALDEDLNKVFGTKDADEWMKILDEAGIPVAPINDISHIMTDPQILARNMILPMNDPELPAYKVAGNPIKMTNLPTRSSVEKAPAIGEHNASVLADILGYTDAQVKSLQEEGVLG